MDEKQGQSMELASIFLIHRKLHPMNQNLFREKLDILIFLRIIKNANKLQIRIGRKCKKSTYMSCRKWGAIC